MLGLLITFVEGNAGSRGLYTRIPAYPGNLTTRTSPDTFLLNVTISASGARDDAAPVVNDTVALPVSDEEIEPDAGTDYDTAASEVKDTFTSLLAIWFRTSKKRYRTVVFTLTCNDSYSAVLMTSPRTQLAFAVFLKGERSRTLYIHSFSTRQCMRRIEELLTGELADRIRHLLGHTCHTYRLTPEEQVDRERRIKTIVGKTVVFREAYSFTNILIAFIFLMLCAVFICLSALFCPNLCQEGHPFPKRARIIWRRSLWSDSSASSDRRTFSDPEDANV